MQRLNQAGPMDFMKACEGMELHAACAFGDPEQVKDVIARGASLNKQALTSSKRHAGTTPLILSSRLGLPRIVRLLVEAGADVNVPKKSGATAIYIASQEGKTKCLKVLIESGSDIRRIPHRSGVSPLYIASQKGHESCVRLLCRAGADVNRRFQKSQSTPLFIAAQQGHAECVRTLIKFGADIQLKNMFGMTAAMIAIKFDNPNTLRLLLDTGKIDGSSDTKALVSMASKLGRTQCLDALLDREPRKTHPIQSVVDNTEALRLLALSKEASTGLLSVEASGDPSNSKPPATWPPIFRNNDSPGIRKMKTKKKKRKSRIRRLMGLPMKMFHSKRKPDSVYNSEGGLSTSIPFIPARCVRRI